MKVRLEKSDLEDEVRRLTAMVDEAAARPSIEFGSTFADSNFSAMCMGALLALVWIFDEGQPPSVEIPRKIREVHEQQTPSTSNEV